MIFVILYLISCFACYILFTTFLNYEVVGKDHQRRGVVWEIALFPVVNTIAIMLILLAGLVDLIYVLYKWAKVKFFRRR